LGAYAKWKMAQMVQGRDRQTVSGMDRRLQEHVDWALQAFGDLRKEISGAMVKHQVKLADRQCRIAELSQRGQDVVTLLVTTLWAHQRKSETTTMAADVLCQDLRRKLTGQRPSDAYFKQVSQLADAVLAGGFEELAGVPRGEILQKYENKK